MALSLDPATKVISVPQGDLTFISGTLYELDTDQFRKDVMALLASESYIWMEDAFSHNTEVTVAGTTFARTLEFINGYSIEFTPNSAWTARLIGSNNNIFDVENGILVQNQVQVIPTNSAGLVNANPLADVLEGTVTTEDALRIILAAVAGKSTKAGNNFTFRDQSDSKDRITSTTDGNGSRTSVAVDGT